MKQLKRKTDQAIKVNLNQEIRYFPKPPLIFPRLEITRFYHWVAHKIVCFLFFEKKFKLIKF